MIYFFLIFQYISIIHVLKEVIYILYFSMGLLLTVLKF